MPRTLLRDLFRLLRRECADAGGAELSDGALLERYLARRDEAAFEALLRRHGPMVLGVCRRAAGDDHAAEDAFQATFLILAKKAASIRKQTSLGSWLHGVARRVASRARSREAARRDRERRATTVAHTEPADEVTWRELRGVLDEEVGRLPEKYRAPVVLCHLEGMSYDQAARALGCPKSSLARRLTRAHELLRGQLARRGVTLSVGALTAALTEKATAAPVPALLAAGSVQAAARVAAGQTLAGLLPARALTLAEEVLKSDIAVRGKWALALLVLGLAAGAGLAGYVASVGQPPPAADVQPQPAAQGEPAPKEAPRGPGVDRHGDALPEGAVARLGTLRFRHRGSAAMTYSPDGKVLATLGGRPELMLYLLEADTGKVLHRRSLGSRLFEDDMALAFSPDSKTLVIANAVIDVATGKDLRQFGPREEVTLKAVPGSITACSPDGRMVARQQWAGKGMGVILFDTATGKELCRMDWDDKVVGPEKIFKQQARPPRPAFSPDNAILATAWPDRAIRLWDVGTGKELRRLEGHTEAVQQLAFSPDRKLLASVGKGEKLVRLWDPQTGKESRTLVVEASDIGIVFTPDGNLLATDAEGGTVRLLDPAGGKELRRWKMPCTEVAISPDGRVLAATAGMVIHRWDLAAGKSLDDMAPGHNSWVAALCFPPGGGTLVSLDNHRHVLEWDLATARERGTTFRGRLGPASTYPLYPQEVKISPTGKVAVVRHVLYDLVTGKDLHVLGGKPLFGHPEFSPDGKVVAIALKDGVTLRDVATGKPVQHPPPPEGLGLPVGEITCAWSGDGKLLAISFDDRQGKPRQSRVILCEVATGKELRRFGMRPNAMPGVVLSPDGRSLAWLGSGELGVYDTASGKPVFSAEARTINSGLGKMDFSPSGGRLAVAVGDAVEIWEVGSGQRVREFRADQRFVTAVKYSPDGRSLASGGSDSTILIWDLTGRPRGGKGAELSSAEVDAHWSALAGDAGKADAAAWALALAPNQSVPRLAERLRGVPAGADEAAVLQGLRALELERAGTAEARLALEATGKAAPNARLAEAAGAALRRLAARPAAAP